MDNKNANPWVNQLEKDVIDSMIVDYKLTSQNSVRITNEDYEKIFESLLKEEKIKISNSYFEGKNLDSVLLKLAAKSEKWYETHSIHTLYATFGLLDYYSDYAREKVLTAPLVFVPVKISKENGNYYISSINKEVRLNDALIHKLLKEFKISLKYPLDKNFSLGQYLYFVAVKIKALSWSVNNGCFLANFDLTSHDKRMFILDNNEKINSNNLVKNITYFNSEFFNFRRNQKTRINSRYLSLLDTDFDEYRIVKKIADRENLYVRTSSKINELHLLKNSLEAFLLNGSKALVVYENQSQYQRLKEMIENSSMAPYYLDFNSVSTNKKDLLKTLADYDSYRNRPGLTNEDLGESIKEYYDLKNKYKQIINSLRVSNPPMNLSLNKMLEQYYRFNKYPDLSITIPNIAHIDNQKIDEYISAIGDFKNSAQSIKNSIKDHPFYGFSRKRMVKEDYKPLQENIILLSEQLKILKSHINNLHRRFGFPMPQTLKQLKAEFNMVAILSDTENLPPLSWFKDENLQQSYNLVLDIQKTIDENTNLAHELEETYTSDVFKISNDMIQLFVTSSYTPKDVTLVNTKFKKSSRLTENKMVEMMISLDLYRTRERQIEDKIQNLPISFKSYYSDRNFDIAKIEQLLTQVKEYRRNVKYLTNHNVDISKFDVTKFDDTTLMKSLLDFRYFLQREFNTTLDSVEILQSYFDKKICNFGEMDLKAFYNKMVDASLHFASINEYLDFYLARIKLNKLIDKLGDELFELDLVKESEQIFLKAFYRQLIDYTINQNSILTDFSFANFLEEMKRNEELSCKRIEAMQNLFINNVQKYLHNNGLNLKNYELPFITSAYENPSSVPLKTIAYEARESIYNLKSLLLCPIEEVPSLLTNEIYHFDCVFVLPSKETLMKDAIGVLALGDQFIVFDEDYLKGTFEDAKKPLLDKESFLFAASKCYEKVEYISTSYDAKGLNNERRSSEFKSYLYNRLEQDGFEIVKDAKTKSGYIDLLVRPVKSKLATGIIIDKLSSNSLEAALQSIEKTDNEIRDLGYIPCRVIPLSFYMNEEEYMALKHFIVINSDELGDIPSKKTTSKLAMEVLFKHYLSPREVFYMIDDKAHKPLESIVEKIIELSAPLKKDELLNLFENQDKINALLDEMVKGQKIAIKDDFLYLIDHNIEFRTVTRNTKEFRDINNITDIELKTGIIKIVNNLKEIEVDVVVKMILLSLGYQKAKMSSITRLNGIIDELAEKQIILKRDNVLLKA